MKGEWVSVDDSLPEVGEYVLVAPGCHIGVRRLPDQGWDEDTSGWHWETDGEGLRISRVTHWHPIHGPEESE